MDSLFVFAGQFEVSEVMPFALDVPRDCALYFVIHAGRTSRCA